jgi:probable H4MPT-linked C1 transfer pathway protein
MTTEGRPRTPADVIGWDIGGAHVKAARLHRGELVDAVQWPCPLWQGLDRLDAVLALAQSRWPDLAGQDHAVTMTGEMVDAFADREDGVRRISARLAAALPWPRFFAGDAGWCDAESAGSAWDRIASCNWLATAWHVAQAFADQEGLMVDIGSTTTDLIAFRRGRVLTTSRSDAQRLQSRELEYHGVVRTPLCALARRIAWRDAEHNVMNEFFATTADVYRLTGELAAGHDQQPSADGAAKDLPHTRARLSRMIGLDPRDGTEDDWLGFARTWRARQCAVLRDAIDHVGRANALTPDALVVGAGCGAFLVPELVPEGWRGRDYGLDVARPARGAGVGLADLADQARLSAPAVAVAARYARELG